MSQLKTVQVVDSEFMSQNPFPRRLIPALLILTLLTGCSGQPEKRLPEPQKITEEHSLTVEDLLFRADQSLFPESARLKIEAIEQFLSQKPVQARVILNSIDFEHLPGSLQARYFLAQARQAYQTNQNARVFFWLDREAVINNNDPELTAQSHFLKAATYNRFNEFTAALDEWLSLKNPELLDNHPEFIDALWQTLLKTPDDRLQSYDSEETNITMKGWISLALIYHPGKPLKQQLKSLSLWKQNWANHPGIRYLPDNLALLQEKDAHQPEKVAVLLPITGPLGKAGRAIRDGLIAAYYQQLKDSENRQLPELVFMNTHEQDVSLLATQASAEGIELIIGPLDKGNVNLLKTSAPAEITILALNNLESASTIEDDFFEFGLAAEDEAQAVAQRGILDGHTRTLILSPMNSWGDRITSSFTEAWTQQGGEIAGELRYKPDSQFSRLAGQLLLINKSQQRATELNRLLGTKMGFEARRRQDVDMIFIPSHPEAARQLKPALAYQFAGDLPVYATSSAYSGSPDRKNRDLDDLQIPVMPWDLTNNRNSLQSNILSIWPTAKGNYGSLYALGADAFAIYPHLLQLKFLPGSQIDGLTGQLHIDSENRVKRTLSWQVFKNGRLNPLPSHSRKNNNVLDIATEPQQ